MIGAPTLTPELLTDIFYILVLRKFINYGLNFFLVAHDFIQFFVDAHLSFLHWFFQVWFIMIIAIILKINFWYFALFFRVIIQFLLILSIIMNATHLYLIHIYYLWFMRCQIFFIHFGCFWCLHLFKWQQNFAILNHTFKNMFIHR